MLEADLKAVTCFRQAANKPFVEYQAAEETLRGLLKELEANPSNLMCPEHSSGTNSQSNRRKWS